jgi:hypothetical protein
VRFLRNAPSSRTVPTFAVIQQGLRDTFHFSDADLAANRAGRMGKEQHYWFVDSFLRRTFISLGITVCLGYLSFRSLRDSLSSSFGIVTIGPLLLGLAFLIGIVFTVRNSWQMLIDAISWRADVVAGRGRISVRRQGRATLYSLDIENFSFDISKKATEAIIDDKYYSVYYAPHSKVILSVEVEA